MTVCVCVVEWEQFCCCCLVLYLFLVTLLEHLHQVTLLSEWKDVKHWNALMDQVG